MTDAPYQTNSYFNIDTLYKWMPIFFAILYILGANFSEPIFKDEASYYLLARNIFNGLGFTILDQPSAIIPAWPLTIVPILALKLDMVPSIVALRAFSLLFSISSLFLIRKLYNQIELTFDWFNKEIKVVSYLLTATCMVYQASVGTLYTEPFALFLLLTSTIILIKPNSKGIEYLFGGFLFASMILTKYVLFSALPFLLLFLFFSKNEINRNNLKTGLFLIPILALCIPFFYYMNYVISHNLSDFSYASQLPIGKDISLVEKILITLRLGFGSSFSKFHELYSTIALPKLLPLSIIIILIMIIPLIKSIKSVKIFHPLFVYPVTLIGTLILLGTGFSRYWYVIIPFLSILFIGGMQILINQFRFKIQLISFKNKTFIIGISLLVILISFGFYILKYPLHNKSIAIVFGLLLFTILILSLIPSFKTNQMVYLVFCPILIWNGARSYAQFNILHRPLDKTTSEWAKYQKNISDLIIRSNKKSQIPFVISDYDCWLSVYTGENVRNHHLVEEAKFDSCILVINNSEKNTEGLRKMTQSYNVTLIDSNSMYTALKLKK